MTPVSTTEMSYNWQSADTPQGRERLKELMDRGIELIAYLGLANRYADISLENGTYFIDGECAHDSIEELINDDDYFRYLDPEPPKPQPLPEYPQLADKYAILHRALSKIRRMRKTERYWDGEAMTKVAIEALEKVK